MHLTCRCQSWHMHQPDVAGGQVDFNLYGMGFIRLGKVLFRGALPATPLLPPRGWLHRTELHHPGQSGPGLFPAPMSCSWHAAPHHMHGATLAHSARQSACTCSTMLLYSAPLECLHLVDDERRGFKPTAGSATSPAPVGTSPMLSPAEYNRTWAAATVPADWQWGPQTQNPRYRKRQLHPLQPVKMIQSQSTRHNPSKTFPACAVEACTVAGIPNSATQAGL